MNDVHFKTKRCLAVFPTICGNDQMDLIWPDRATQGHVRQVARRRFALFASHGVIKGTTHWLLMGMSHAPSYQLAPAEEAKGLSGSASTSWAALRTTADWVPIDHSNASQRRLLRRVIVLVGGVAVAAVIFLLTHSHLSAATRGPARRCVVLEAPDVTTAGYGDYFRTTHRCDWAAQVLGCECVRPYQTSTHHYASSNLLSNGASHINLASSRTCALEEVLDAKDMQESYDCDAKIIGDPTRCDIYSYRGRSKPNFSPNKLHCVADRMREKLIFNSMSVSPARQACDSGYAALHFRYGDIALGNFTSFRLTSPSDIQLALEHINTKYNFSPECVVVFAEGYPEEFDSIVGVTLPHTIDRTNDALQVMTDMARSTVLFGGRSGFMQPVAVAFTGQELVIPAGTAFLFERVIRNDTVLTTLES